MADEELTQEELAERIPEADENSEVTHLPDNVGPNFHVSIAPNGYIRFSVGFDLMHASGFCDAEVARGMAEMLLNAAEAQEEVMEQITSQEDLAEASNVIEMPERPAPAEDDTEDSATNVPVEEASATDVPAEASKFDTAVEDAEIAQEEGWD